MTALLKTAPRDEALIGNDTAKGRGRISTTVWVNLCRLAIGTNALIWLAAGDGLHFAVALIALVLTAAPTLLIRDPQLRNCTAALNALLLGAHIVLGMQLDLYETSALYDKFMHTLGSAGIAAILTIAVQSYCTNKRIELPLNLVLLLVFAGTLSTGTVWEMFEFAVDRTELFVAQRGLQDTMVDLLADAFGAVIVLSAIAVRALVNQHLSATPTSWRRV